MKVAGCVTRLVIFTVVIIMGVLALIVPAVLEDYWFEADMQRNMEDIAVALDNPFCREALLPIGLIGVLFNSVALAFGVRLRRKRGRKERAMQLPAFFARYTRGDVMNFFVYVSRIVICLIILGYAAAGALSPAAALNKFVVALAVFGTVGSAAALGICVTGRRSVEDERLCAAADAGAADNPVPPAMRNMPAPQAQPAQQHAMPVAAVRQDTYAPAAPSVPVQPAPPVYPAPQPQMHETHVEEQFSPYQTPVPLAYPASQTPIAPPVYPAPQAPIAPPVYPAPQTPIAPPAYGGMYDDVGGGYDMYGGYYDAYGNYHPAGFPPVW